MPRKKIGLALSGGGARGFAHVGVLDVLAEHEIPIDYIAGTSIGSFVGGAFATGMTVAELEKLAKSVKWRHMTRPSFSPRALLSNAPMAGFIRRNFPVTTFEELKIPFTAVACDLVTGKEVRLRETGDLVSAIRASCAVPAVFLPVKNGEGTFLVDGGMASLVPIDAVREMGADVIIAVDLLSSGAPFNRPPRTAIGILFSSAMNLVRSAAGNQKYKADLVITPKIAHIRPDRLNQRDECFALGKEAALAEIAEIKRVVSG
jgi:NTE family protein